MTDLSVVPLTSSVNRTMPVASTATNRCTSGFSAEFSVTASASTRVKRAPQPAPGDGELIGGADRLGELGQTQQRQQQEQHQEAAAERRRDHHCDQHEVVEMHVEQKLRHQN